MQGAAGGLQQTLKQNFAKDGDGTQTANGGIDRAVLHGFRHIGLDGIIEPAAKSAKEHKDGGSDQHQENTVAGSPVGALPIAFAQGFTQQRVDTHRDTGAKADLDILHRECQTQGGHGAFRDPGHINTVHHIIQRLHQHTEDHGRRHIKQQFANGHDAHFIFLQRRSFLFHHHRKPLLSLFHNRLL